MRRSFPWLAGALAATLLLAALPLLNGLRYADTADALMTKAFAGYLGGAPAHFHPELHTALSWLLCGLQSALPRVPWLSVLQLAALWLACAVTVKGAARAAGMPRLGAAAGIALFAGFGLFSICRVDHAATAALVGMAAVVQLMNVDYRAVTDKQAFAAVLPSVGLILLSYCLYQPAGLTALAIWLMGFAAVRLGDYSHREVLARGTSAHNGLRGLLACVWTCVFAVACFWGVRAIELGAMKEYTEWQSALAALRGSAAFPDGVTNAMLEAAGWTRERLNAVAGGFLYGNDVTAESMRRLAALLPQPPTGPGVFVARAAGVVAALWQAGGLSRLWLAALCALWLAATCARAPRGGRVYARLAPLLSLGVSFAALGFACDPAALDGAAALAALAPSAGLMAMLALRGQGAGAGARPTRLAFFAGVARSALLAAAAVACLACAVAGQTETALLPVRAATYEASLARYALDRPDKLIFCSPELTTDTAMFPAAGEAPQNLVTSDPTAMRGDALTKQLQRFGLDGASFRLKQLLNDNVLIAGTSRGPWRTLLPYLQQSMTGTYNWAAYEDAGDVRLYKLCER